MKFSLNWLREIIGKDLPDEKIETAVTFHLTESELESFQEGLYDKMLVAEIMAIKPHPNADKLQLVEVSLGQKKQMVICGAPNIKVGQKIALALVGSKLPGLDNVVLEATNIRGVKSNGMLLAPDELGVGYSHEGVIVLDSKLKPGTPLSKIIKIDRLLDVDLLANRPDCLAHVGLAWDIAGTLGVPFKYQYTRLENNKELPSLKIAVLNKKLAPRYMAVSLSDIKVGPSPLWLSKRLEDLGYRSINNVVDATNLVMLELGQPLHAFDQVKLGSDIKVRPAKKGEMLTTLDGVKRTLSDKDLVIASGSKAVALAGIMGGQDSEVSDQTSEIVLESAVFNGTNIRRSYRRLGITSDSALRFEKGLAPSSPPSALARAVKLLQEVAGAKVSSQIADVKKPMKGAQKLKFDPQEVENKIGYSLSLAQIIKALKAYGFKVKTGRVWEVTVPSWRTDIKEEVDLVEEVARYTGFDKILESLPSGQLQPPLIKEEFFVERRISEILTANGFYEVATHTFLGQKEVKKIGFEGKLVELANPQSPDLAYFRPSLLPGLLGILARAQKESEIGVFENGTIFFGPNSKPTEVKRSSWAFSGFNSLEKAKVFLKTVMNKLNIKDFQTLGQDFPMFEKGRAGILAQKDLRFGFLGQVKESILNDFDLTKEATYVELDLTLLSELSLDITKVKDISRQPAVDLDLSIIVNKNYPYAQISKGIELVKPDNLESFELIDVYKGKGMPEDTRSLAFRFVFRDFKRTLKREEAEKMLDDIFKELKARFKVVRR